MARRGENIHKRKDGRWEGRYISSRLPNGKAKYSSVYGKTYLEVKQKLLQEKLFTENKKQKTNKNILFKDVLDLWLKANYPKLKDSTIIKYSNLIEKHIISELGDYSLSSLNTIVLNAFMENKLKKGKIDNSGGLSPSYARTIMIIIKSALLFAVDEKLCSTVPTNFFIPKVNNKVISVLSDNEQYELEKYLFSNINSTTIGIILSLYTGLRVGEICALRWSDINFNQKTICIRNSVSIVKNINGKGSHFEITSPKTNASIRDIPIPTVILPYLKKCKNEAKSSFVVSVNEQFVNPRTFEYRFHKVIKDAGLNDFNFHKLRHTFATRCIEKDVDAKTLSLILGHSNVSVTLNLYVHPTMQQKTKQINKLTSKIA